MRVDTQRKIIEHAANLDEVLLNESDFDENEIMMILDDAGSDETDSKKQKTE